GVDPPHGAFGPAVRRAFSAESFSGAAMSTTDESSQADSGSMPGDVDLKLEVVVIPVSDVDRSKAFYAGLGWRLDADFTFDNGFRVVQFTPPGSGASMQLGTNIT